MSAVVPGRGERLNRFLARRGLASRRSADGLIAAGRVSVNGVVATIGTRVTAGADVVSLDGVAVGGDAPVLATIALHKPVGVVSTRSDPQQRPTVADLAPALPGLVPVGRLDADSRGLLLMTTDGELAHRVAHPRYGVRKTYRVRLSAAVGDAALEALVDGVVLDDGPACVLEYHRVDAGGRLIDVVMGEGRRREVRRLFRAVGNEVEDLCRTAIGPIRLGRLAAGGHRSLSAAESAALRAAVGLAEEASA